MKIVGSGLIASAFQQFAAEFPKIVLYAAGVSNSACDDDQEFARDRERLVSHFDDAKRFVYVSTWGASTHGTPYQRHKHYCESEVEGNQSDFLILRLPNILGRTANPHTLANYLYARIARSERFTLRSYAHRNVLDVDDVAALTCAHLLKAREKRQYLVNATYYTLPQIVAEFERITGKQAIYDIDEAGDYPRPNPDWNATKVNTPADYLATRLAKYYP